MMDKEFETEIQCMFNAAYAKTLTHPVDKSLQKLGHQLLAMGVNDLAQEYFKIAGISPLSLGQETVTQIRIPNLNFLPETTVQEGTDPLQYRRL
jgi:hypothetical protein